MTVRKPLLVALAVGVAGLLAFWALALVGHYRQQQSAASAAKQARAAATYAQHWNDAGARALRQVAMPANFKRVTAFAGCTESAEDRCSYAAMIPSAALRAVLDTVPVGFHVVRSQCDHLSGKIAAVMPSPCHADLNVPGAVLVVVAFPHAIYQNNQRSFVGTDVSVEVSPVIPQY